MKTIVCGDVLKGCQHTMRAETETELLARLALHIREEHPEVELKPALIEEARRMIREFSLAA